MGKEVDPRIAEYAYIDRIVLFHQVGSGMTIVQGLDAEGNPTEIQEPCTTTNINMVIRYEVKDQNKINLHYKEVTHQLFFGEGTKSVQEIATLINDNLNTFAVADKYDITGFQPS